MSDQLQVVRAEVGAVAAPSSAPSVAEMFAIAQKGGNADAMKTVAELMWKQEERQAGRDYAEAFKGLQRAIPRIKAIHIVPDKNGNKKFKVAKFEEIMTQLSPLLEEHGFTINFPQRYEEGLPLRITVTCRLQHTASGHATETPFTVRVGNGPPGCGDSQADGAASSYAKMRALCMALNIVIEPALNDDASALGNVTDKVTKAQADELEHRAAMTNSNRVAFLQLAGADSFAEIPASSYPILDRMLTRKEKGPQ